MAIAFRHWLETMPTERGGSVFAPAGYISSMGDFVSLVAKEMRPRLGLDCEFSLGVQSDFSQPMILVNDTPVDSLFEQWNPAIAWDSLADYQKEKNQ